MAVDSATTIAALNAALPAGSDPAAELDNNIRHVKSVLVGALPNVAGVVTSSHTELSRVTGVTAPIQAQLDAKAPTASPALTGTPTAPTPSTADSSTRIATTAHTQAAIAAVNAASGNLVRSTNPNTSFSVAAGQLIAATNSGAWTATFPPSPTTGAVCGVYPQNGRTDNAADLGPNSIIGPNGVVISGVVTLDQPAPFVVAWYGDYWRAA